ncbi:MAG: hypothetical protein ABWY06_19465 [Pseudomonas sp.]|uniref:hypothetical protein n=1 Tax=Pseudomonas sp. TaxID=306 RepID=UPI003391B0E7
MEAGPAMNGERTLNDNGVLVLGMHRSGTSAVAACLERLGVVMGDALVPADKWNPKGYFEERRIVAFNNQLLDLQGVRWDSPLPPAPALQAPWSGQAAPAAALLQELYAGTLAWGFKDPRLCLLAPFWQPVFAALQVRPRMLLVLRHPAEVADSLARRDGIAIRRAGWLWFTHLLGALDYLQTATDSRLIDFADVLSEPALHLGELGKWLGLSPGEGAIERFANDFIAPQLARSADARATRLHPLILRAYNYWRTTACNRRFAPEWLQAPEWLAIRNAFEHDIKPELEAVQRFFAGDRQASEMDARLMAISRGLADSEQLALLRLEQIASLDAQLKCTSNALAATDTLARQRLAEVEARDRELQLRSERWSQVEQAMDAREQAWAKRFSELEGLAEERLQRLHALDQQLRHTTEALAQAEQLALERLAELEQAIFAGDRQAAMADARLTAISQGLAASEQLAVVRLEQIAALDAQLKCTSDALAATETLARQRLVEVEALDAELRARSERWQLVEQAMDGREQAWAKRFSQLECLAEERLQRLHALDQQLGHTTEALARAEQLALARLAELERASDLK